MFSEAFAETRTSSPFYKLLLDKRLMFIEDKRATLQRDALHYKDWFADHEINDFDNYGDHKIDLQMLLSIGVLLCRGSEHMKATIFYNILQDCLAEKIASSDKDIDKVFWAIIEFSTDLIMRLECEFRPQTDDSFNTLEFELSKLTISAVMKLKEEMLDEVFDNKATLPRDLFIKKIEKQQSWLLSSEKVRKRV